MQFTFTNMSGTILFIRDDAERATWTQEEMTLDAEFPYLSNKRISIGQRILFKDPSTNTQQVYEIKQARSLEPDHYQTIVAENICVSELSDEHIDNKELTNVTVKSALQTVLTGTLWEIGNVSVNPRSSADISRGSVWQAILQIKDNWNVYIEPRVSIDAKGAITRVLDVKSTEGAWNGMRLSINKNMLDPSVTYDDSEVVTALYGYGGTPLATKAGEEEKEVTFADVVWSKTDDHPAKPRGETFLEDPDATRAYGRAGRARFGFYQNTDILDANVLLEKTWETLKTVSKPAISIEGTVADLRRLGYKDTPIRLHDIALVEVNPVGYKDQIQIIRITTDLLDPSATTLTIGAYIPNIIYIERQTNEQATGSRGGGGGSNNKSKQTVRSEYETEINKNNRMIQLRAYQNDLDNLDSTVKLQEAKIEIEADRITQEVTNRTNGDNELTTKINQTATEITTEVNNEVKDLNTKITQQADRISLVVSGTGTNAKIRRAAIVASINNGKSNVLIEADAIDIKGIVNAMKALSIQVQNLTVDGDIDCQETVTAGSLQAAEAIIDGDVSSDSITTDDLKVGSYSASWKSKTVVTGIDRSASRNFVYAVNGNLSNLATLIGTLCTGVTSDSIYYLGR